MSNPFDLLMEQDPDDTYTDRVEFFLSLKEKLGAAPKQIAKDDMDSLLNAPGVRGARLRSAGLGTKVRAKDVGGFKSESTVAKSVSSEEAPKIKGIKKMEGSSSEAKAPKAKPAAGKKINMKKLVAELKKRSGRD